MVEVDNKTLYLRPSDEITIYQVEGFAKRLIPLLEGLEEIKVDMRQVGKIDTAGFQLLISLKKSCEASGKKFEIYEINGSVSNFMKLYDYDL